MHTGISSNKLDISKEKDTKLISRKFLKFLNPGDHIYLFGDIGVGKTTFIKYIINFLQAKYDEKKTEIPSPTFNIVNEYKIKKFKILHYDLYRVKDKHELENIGILENNKEYLIFVEWPKLINIKNSNKIILNFKYEDDFKKRSLIITSNTNRKLINEFKSV